MGGGGLTAEDHYLMKVNLEDLENTSGEIQEYWLLAIRAAREAFGLQRIADSTVATVGNKVGAYIRGRPLPVFPIYSTQKAWPAAGVA